MREQAPVLMFMCVNFGVQFIFYAAMNALRVELRAQDYLFVVVGSAGVSAAASLAVWLYQK